MKKINHLLSLAIFFATFSINAQVNFNYTGAQQTYTVPAGISSISIEVYGAQGGTSEGGEGGYAYGELAVTPGQLLYIYVGGQGNTTAASSGSSLGGWNGGGAGGSGTSGASGGGASDVRIGGITLANRIIVAGGGGGMDFDGSINTPGGDGGGLIGVSGTVAGTNGTASTGGTQTTGGTGGTASSYTGNPGVLGVGGATVFYTNSTYQYGGGGGGGYYGGSSGHPWCSGAGGSSYIGGVTNGTTTAGGRTGNGLVVITQVCSATSIAPDLVTLADINGECSVTQPTAPTATNNCGLTVSGIPDITFPVTSQGTTSITWTYDDGNGNTVTQSQNVVIADATAPIADNVSLSDITSECEVTSLTAPTATDNCAGLITGTHNAILPITTQGTTTITWTYDDGSGNTSTQAQDVIITDLAVPIADIANLPQINSECDVTPTAPTATDNCAGAIVGTPDVSIPVTAAGTTIITWTYDDGNGNTTTQTQNVNITPIDNGITQVDAVTLSADAAGYSYQWVDCDNGNAPISGATNQSFTPTIAGNYACEIDNGTCTITTACLSSAVGINENDFGSALVVYPNPTYGDLSIDLGSTYSNINVHVYSSLGQSILNKRVASSSSIELNIDEAPGVYLIEIRTEERKSAIIHVIKK